MKPLKIKVACAGILDRCTVPWAVLTAEISIPGKPHTRTRYVLLDDDIRDGLSRMRRDIGRGEDSNGYSAGYGEVHRMLAPECAFPPLLRTHAFTAAGVQHDPEEPIARRAGTWVNSEPLWVRTDLARLILGDLDRWRSANPPHKDQIWAPSWLALLGAQALALGAGLPMPSANPDVEVGVSP